MQMIKIMKLVGEEEEGEEAPRPGTTLSHLVNYNKTMLGKECYIRACYSIVN
jgi:hypothetical protein